VDPDAELVNLIRSGETKAFDQLVERYRDLVYRLAYRSVLNKQVALDISQEVWVKVYNSIDGFRGDSAFKTWLYRLAVNEIITYTRKMKRQGGILPPGEDYGGKDYAVGENAGSDYVDYSGNEQTDDILNRLAIREAVEKLPPRQRMIFILKFYQGLTHEEIASLMKRSVGAVKSSYFHALRKLAVFLESPE